MHLFFLRFDAFGLSGSSRSGLPNAEVSWDVGWQQGRQGRHLRYPNKQSKAGPGTAIGVGCRPVTTRQVGNDGAGPVGWARSGGSCLTSARCETWHGRCHAGQARPGTGAEPWLQPSHLGGFLQLFSTTELFPSSLSPVTAAQQQSWPSTPAGKLPDMWGEEAAGPAGCTHDSGKVTLSHGFSNHSSQLLKMEWAFFLFIFNCLLLYHSLLIPVVQAFSGEKTRDSH